MERSIPLIAQLPVYFINNPQYLKIRLADNINFDGDWIIKPSKGFVARETINNLPLPNAIKAFDPFDAFCKNSKCSIMKNHSLMAVDPDYLSPNGSRVLVVEQIVTKDAQFFKPCALRTLSSRLNMFTSLELIQTYLATYELYTYAICM